jgi:hypothetical protein
VVGTLLFSFVLGIVMAIVLNALFGIVIGAAAASISFAFFRLYHTSRSPGGRPDSDYDTPDVPRLSDKEEVQAYRALRRGRITRFQYERVVARRKYAHLDLTPPQFDELMAYINDAEAGRIRFRPR